MKLKRRLFLILFLAGMAGVASFLLIDLSALVGLVDLPAGSDTPTITPAIKLLSLVQPAILLAVAVLIGIALAPNVGLSAPMAESLASGAPWFPAFRRQLAPGFLGGLVGALCVVLTAAVFTPFLTTQAVDRIQRFTSLVPLPTRILYGGITEELLLRWGFMTLVVWVLWRVLQKQVGKPTRVSFVAAILISSLVFAVGHLPVAAIVVGEITVAVTLFVIIANSAFGVVAGYLYWRYGLEAAIIAHMFGHVVLAVASYAGGYF